MRKIIASSLILAILSSCTMMCAASNSLYDCWSDDSSDEYHYGSEFLYFDNSSDTIEDTDTAQDESIYGRGQQLDKFYEHMENAIQNFPRNETSPLTSMDNDMLAATARLAESTRQYNTSRNNKSYRNIGMQQTADDMAYRLFMKKAVDELKNISAELSNVNEYCDSMYAHLESLKDPSYTTLQGNFWNSIGNTDPVTNAALYSFASNSNDLYTLIEEHQTTYKDFHEKNEALSTSIKNLMTQYNSKSSGHTQRVKDAFNKCTQAVSDWADFRTDHKITLESGLQPFEDFLYPNTEVFSLYPNLQIDYNAYNYDAWNE